MKTIIIIIITLGLSIGISGCDEWLTVQPDTMITPDELYNTPAGFKDALIGCYQLMEGLYIYKGPMITGTIEDLACTWETTKNSVPAKMGLHEYDDQSVDQMMQQIFQSMYKVIANVSELIRALESQDGVLEEKMYSKYMGEARGLRAFLHLELMRLWGPMPSNIRPEVLYLPFVEGIQIAPYKYLTFSTYMKKVQDDLDYAEKLLKKDILDIWHPRVEYMNYYAVLAIQARYHFWMGNKEEALDYGNRLLEPDTLKHFPLYDASLAGTINGDDDEESLARQTAFTKESILRYHYKNNKGIVLSKYNYESYVSKELFEGSGSDSRLYQWRKELSDEGKEARMLLTKYDVEKDPQASDDDMVYGFVPLIRISEIYLMLMELESMDRANALYAEFADARGIATKVFTSKGELLNHLQLEYRREFIGEGQMFFAYKRWATVYMPRALRGCGESAYVPPIPRKEFDLSN